MRGKILVVDHRTPRPDQDSGSASTFAYLQILSRSGFSVTFATFNMENAGHYTRALNDLGIRTLMAPEWPSLLAVIETFAPQSDIVLLYRAPVAGQLFDLARRSAPAAKIIFHPVDLHFLRMQRGAAVSGNPAELKAAQDMRTLELDLIARADATIVVSEYEIGLLQQLLPEAVVYQIPILREAPARPQPFDRGPNFESRRDFLFIGCYLHAPNGDAVQWFVQDIWPKLQRKDFPDRFVVAGSGITEQIAALASEKIVVRGYVEDLAPLFAACRMSVAPIRYGGGIKGKIVSSLSYGVPVVATSIAAEGMGLRPDEDILIADDPDLMAEQMMRLYHDADLWQRLSANGYQVFQDRFSLAAGAGKVLPVFDGLVAARSRER
jgi:glycosyltransferase involved in cell wall biosynthesis